MRVNRSRERNMELPVKGACTCLEKRGHGAAMRSAFRLTASVSSSAFISPHITGAITPKGCVGKTGLALHAMGPGSPMSCLAP